jgi:competence protein ComEC
MNRNRHGVRAAAGGFLLALLLVPAGACDAPGGEARIPGSAPDPGGSLDLEAALGETTAAGAAGSAGGEPLLVLTFLDVGQGDAVLIQSPTGQAVLYDGGERSAGLAEQLRRRGVRGLDLVIASHNHADHIGGLPEVIREFRPRFVMDNGVPHTTRTYENFLQAIEAAGSQLLAAERRTIRLGDAELEIIPPPGRSAWGHNDNSVGVRVRFGEFRATLLGDAEHRQFEWWLRQHRDAFEPVQVHKASHHASRNGDTPEAIRALRPEVVVIGVGADNTYGHPHPEALELYRSINAVVYRTDEHGAVSIEARSSGEYAVRTERGEAQPATAASCVDVNRAATDELLRILHIDAERAEQILRLRQERAFRSVGELTRVSGIGAARVREIQEQGLACVAP